MNNGYPKMNYGCKIKKSGINSKTAPHMVMGLRGQHEFYYSYFNTKDLLFYLFN